MEERLSVLGVDLPGYLDTVALQVAMLHATIGTLIPLALACMLTGFFGERKRFAGGLSIWPFALFAALAMTVPYVLVAAVLGPEFPSLLGGLTGLVIVMFASSRGFLLPENVWDFPPRERCRRPGWAACTRRRRISPSARWASGWPGRRTSSSPCCWS